LGNWLSVEQSRNQLQAPNASTTLGKRDRAVLSLLLGCGLRRGEVSNLRVRDIQQRDDHWAVVDLVWKARHMRTVPIPDCRPE
jgi:site-specific recombinase XerD